MEIFRGYGVGRKKKVLDTVSGKTHPPTRGAVGDTRIKGRSPGPQAAYRRAAGKADTKSFNAKLVTGPNSAKAHTQAVQAHHQAAVAAEKAGLPEQATHHRQQANTHSFAARNGAFGTDPTTGNAQSKAKVGGSDKSPSAYAKRAQMGSANMARERALTATEHANKVNTPEAHRTAADAHGKAATAAKLAGIEAGARTHSLQAKNHALLAKEGGKANLNQGTQTGGGANNASHIPVHPAMRGEASTKYNSATLRKQLASQPRNIPHPTARGVTTKGAMSGMSTEAAEAHTDASAHAFAQGTKANAKPSLASHSMAAKAHLQAATHYGTNDSRHAQHLQQAEVHRTHATTHSQRIMKLKKLGPGQKHGAGGRFTGVPGGAK